jgi:MFS family permease
LISLTGTWLQQVAQGWLVYRLTGSAFLLGLTTTIGSLPMLALAVWGGVAADRYNKHRIILITQCCAMMLALTLGGLALSGVVTIWHVVVLAALLGVVNAFDMPARQAFVPEIVGREGLMNAIALNSTVFNAARVLGPAVAGALIGQVGVAWCFVLNGASYAAVIAGLLRMRLPPFQPRDGGDSVLAHALGGFAYVRGTPIILALIALNATCGIFGWSYAVLMPVFARDVFHGGSTTYGFLMSASGAGALVGSLVLASYGSVARRDAMVFGGLAAFAIALIGFTLAPHVLPAAACLAVAGACGIVSSATSNTCVQSLVPDELRGRVMGIWSLVFAGATPIGSFEAGTLAQQFGAPAAVRIGCLVCLATALFLALRTRPALD